MENNGTGKAGDSVLSLYKEVLNILEIHSAGNERIETIAGAIEALITRKVAETKEKTLDRVERELPKVFNNAHRDGYFLSNSTFEHIEAEVKKAISKIRGSDK